MAECGATNGDLTCTLDEDHPEAEHLDENAGEGWIDEEQAAEGPGGGGADMSMTSNPPTPDTGTIGTTGTAGGVPAPGPDGTP